MTYSLPSISTVSMDSLSGTLLCFELPKSRPVPYCSPKICSQVGLLMGFILLIRLSESIQGLSPKILGEQSFQVTLAERDHVIEQITPATAHPTLGDAVLPRA